MKNNPYRFYKMKKFYAAFTAMLLAWPVSAAWPTGPAPLPTADESTVVSIFSDAYPSQFKFQTEYADWNSDQFETTKTVITPFDDIADEHVLFVDGLSTGSTQHNAQIALGSCNLKGTDKLHLDIYSPSDNGIGEFSIYLISDWNKTVSCGVWYDFSEKNEFDKWISLDIPMSNFSGLNLSNINVLRIVRGKKGPGGTAVYIDNIYAYGNGTTIPEPGKGEATIKANGNADLTTDVPLIPAPVPVHASADVFNFFSNHYNNGKFDYRQSDYGDLKTSKSFVTISGSDDEVFKIENLVNGAKANVSLGAPNLSGYDMLHLDIFSPGSEIGIGEFDFALTDWSGNGKDAGIWLNITDTGWHGQWISIDIPLSTWTGNINMVRFRRGSKGSKGSTLYVDNFYAYKSGGSTVDPDPDTGVAPDPTTVPSLDIVPEKVTSIFCEQYESAGYQAERGITSAGNWGQNSKQKEEFVEIVDGNSTLKLTDWDLFPFKIHRTSEYMDLSEADYIHMDVYQKGALDITGKKASIQIWLNDKDNKVAQCPLLTIRHGEWTSLSFGLDYARGVIDLSRVYVIRLKVGGYPAQDIYVDNIVAYRGAALENDNVTEPYEPEAGTPIQDSTSGILPPADKAYLGVNLASASGGNNPGTFGHDYMYPRFEDLYYFKAKGVRLLRIPFRAARVQHEIGGELDYDAEKSDIKALADVVREAERLGMWVLLDMHDYCERSIDGVLYEYGVAGRRVWNSSTNSWDTWEATDAPVVTTEHFADLWKKIATEFKDYTNIWGYDLTNEPKGIDIDILFNNYQAAINAIREVDTKASVVIEGKNYASSSAWESVSDKLKDLADPQGKIVYEAHAYFDRSSSGTYPGTYDQEINNTEIYRDRIDPFVNWCEKNGKKGMLGEFGVPYTGHSHGDARYDELIDKVFSYLKEKQLTATYWCGGAMYDSYMLTVQPAKDYATEKSTMKVMEKYIRDFDQSSSGMHNPMANDKVKFTFNGESLVLTSKTGIDNIKIYDLNGNLLLSNSNALSIDCSALAPGVYIAKATTDAMNVHTDKIVK